MVFGMDWFVQWLHLTMVKGKKKKKNSPCENLLNKEYSVQVNNGVREPKLICEAYHKPQGGSVISVEVWR